MKLSGLLYLIVVVFFFNVNQSKSEEPVQFNSDYSVFQGNDNKALIEIYYSFYMGSLHYNLNNGNYLAEVLIEIKISKKSDNSVITDQKFSSNSTLQDTSGSNLKRNLIGQLNFSIQSGDYLLEIIGSDKESNLSADTIKYSVSIPENLQETYMSDVELASEIKKSSQTNNSFYKNTLTVIPNPANLFGNNLKMIYYYFELYNLKPDINYIIEKKLYDFNKNLLFTSGKTINPKNSSIAEYGMIEIDTLNSGIYFLEIILENNLNNIISSKEKKVFVFNPDENKSGNTGIASQNFLTSGYAQMKEEDLDREYDYSRYIRTDAETKNYESLNKLEEKRKFMFDFWKKRDSNLMTPQNEYKIEYLKKVSEANKLFKESFKEGYKSDRGRIYVTYGKPDDVESFPFQSDKKSYQIWKYNSVEGGGQCIFIELNPSTGAYWLVHSTFRNELRNDNWENQLSNQ